MTEYLIYSQSLENYIIDLSSYIFVLILFYLIYLSNYIDRKTLIFFSLYSATPFFVNDFLFSSTLLWDQYTNTYYLIDFRDHILNGNYQNYITNMKSQERKLVLGAHLYGLIPFIFVNSINTIAFANKLILGLTSFYLLKNKYIKKSHLYFLLLFPATIIYSSLSLKEVLLAVSSIWVIILFDKKKYFLVVFLFTSFFLLRPQFYIYISIFIIYYFISMKLIKNKSNFLLFNIILFSSFLTLSFNYTEIIFEKINYFIKVYNQEDVGWGGVLDETSLNYFDYSINSFLLNFKIVIQKLLLNWPVPFKFKIIFLAENLIITYFILKYFRNDFKKNKIQTLVSLAYFISTIFILYVLFPNLLPLHRYFYPFLFFFITFSKFQFKNENTSRYK